MAHETYYRGMQGRVTASHCAAMHSYPNAYAFRLFGWLEKGGLNVIANPFDNLILLAREDTYPKRRAMTRVKELWQAGITVGIGHDSIMDPWYPLGARRHGGRRRRSRSTSARCPARRRSTPASTW